MKTKEHKHRKLRSTENWGAQQSWLSNSKVPEAAVQHSLGPLSDVRVTINHIVIWLSKQEDNEPPGSICLLLASSEVKCAMANVEGKQPAVCSRNWGALGGRLARRGAQLGWRMRNAGSSKCQMGSGCISPVTQQRKSRGGGSGPLKGLSEMPPTKHSVCYGSWQAVRSVLLKVQ